MKLHDQRAMGPIAAAIALAAGTRAYGLEFVTVPASIVSAIGTTATRAWDVDSNGVNDYIFQFRFPNSTGTNGVVWQANMNPSGPVGNAVIGYVGPFVSYATNLASAQPLGPTLPFGASFRTATQVTLASIYRSGGVPRGYGGFYPGNPNPGGGQPGSSHGYAGFRIGTGAASRYGWIELTATSAGIQFQRAAIGDVGELVYAGSPEPEPTSLAAVALGAAAFLSRPRKSRAAQTNGKRTKHH